MVDNETSVAEEVVERELVEEEGTVGEEGMVVRANGGVVLVGRGLGEEDDVEWGAGVAAGFEVEVDEGPTSPGSLKSCKLIDRSQNLCHI